jgi:hypothetical protein
LGGGTIPFFIVYFMPFHMDYIQMSFSPRLPNGSPKIGTFTIQKLWPLIYLSNQVFLKMKGQYIITFKRIFSMMYNMPQLDLIWPLLSKDLWSGIKFPIWFLPLLLIITHANQI